MKNYFMPQKKIIYAQSWYLVLLLSLIAFCCLCSGLWEAQAAAGKELEFPAETALRRAAREPRWPRKPSRLEPAQGLSLHGAKVLRTG